MRVILKVKDASMNGKLQFVNRGLPEVEVRRLTSQTVSAVMLY